MDNRQVEKKQNIQPNDVQLNQSQLTRQEFDHILYFLHKSLTIHVPLSHVVHLAFDSWLPISHHIQLDANDKDVFRKIHNSFKKLKQSKNNKGGLQLPTKLTKSNAKMSSLRQCAVSIIFLKCFGVSVSLYVCGSDADVRIFFNNSYASRIETSDVIFEYIEQFSHVTRDQMESCLVDLWSQDNARAQKFNVTLNTLQTTIGSAVDSTKHVKLMESHTGHSSTEK